MKIIIVAYHFYPENNPRAFRAFELAKELSKNNEIKVITKNKFDYSDIEKKYKITVETINSGFFLNKNKQNVLRNNVEKKEIKIKKNRTLINIYNYIFSNREIEFFYPLLKSIKKIEKPYDAIISIGLPISSHLGSYLGVLFNKLLNNTKLILDYGDPFYFNKTINVSFYFKYIEKIILKRSNFITLPIENAKQAFKYYDVDSKIRIISQGFNFNETKIENYKKNSIPTFLYAGLFYENIRNPLKFFREIVKIKENYKFIIYTDISVLIKMKSYSKIVEILKDSKERIELKSVIPRIECIKEMSKMDFLINLENINSEQSPSKLIDYALSKRPILSFDQNNFDINIFKEFLNGDYHNQTKIELEQYDIKNVTKKFIKLIEGE